MRQYSWREGVHIEIEYIYTSIDIERETQEFYEKKWPQLRQAKRDRLRGKQQRTRGWSHTPGQQGWSKELRKEQHQDFQEIARIHGFQVPIKDVVNNSNNSLLPTLRKEVR